MPISSKDQMGGSSSAIFVLFANLLVSVSWATSSSIHENFLLCLSLNSHRTTPISNVLYTPKNLSYSAIMESSIENLRFSSSATPKPLLILTPVHVSHIQAAVVCSKKYGMHIRVRSGGHDYEGLSYVSEIPFIIIDLSELRSINISIQDGTAWVEAAATVGEVYYRISQKSRTYGFPAGSCPTVGVGGHFSGGGFGTLMRKYGLAADNILDACIVVSDGRVLNRESMGEDLFWAIRGGGGASFGVILSWKIKLAYVPPIVTVFSISKTLEQGALKVFLKWQQVGSRLQEDIFIDAVLRAVTVSGSQEGEERTIQVSFKALFLGNTSELLSLMKESFPELRLEAKDCLEMSWIESVLYYADLTGEPENVLLNRTPQSKKYFKEKSDYVQEPISETGLQGIWKMLFREGAGIMILSPYGGRMDKISETEIPFPHRKGNLYKIQYLVSWDEEGERVSKKHINWTRKLYEYMAPYVSKVPRAAYLNYRDLDLGMNDLKGSTSYAKASIWGLKYFSFNFNRLVHVKTKVDPSNFFSDEQSIPVLSRLVDN